MATTLRISEQEYLDRLTSESPSYEFVNGEVIQKPLTKSPHVFVAKAFANIFLRYEATIGGFFGWETTTDFSSGGDRRYLVPDAAYWAPGKPRGADVFLPPTLAIEIISEGQGKETLREKCRRYRSRGVDVAWLADPAAHTVEVFDDGSDGDVLGRGDVLTSPHLPGLSIQIRSLFEAVD